jgi:molybdenum cofactor biosynthesis enzyme
MVLYTASGVQVRTSSTNKISTAKINKGDVFMVSVQIAGLDRWVTKKFIK